MFKFKRLRSYASLQCQHQCTENDKATELVALHHGGLIIAALNREISLLRETRSSVIPKIPFLWEAQNSCL